MEIKLTWWFVYEWGKPPRQKPHWVNLRSPFLRIHYYQNTWLHIKESQYLIPTYSWTLTPIQCWTLPIHGSKYMTNQLMHESKYVTNTPTWEGYWLQSSSVHLDNEVQEAPWSQNLTAYKRNNFFKRKMN